MIIYALIRKDHFDYLPPQISKQIKNNCGLRSLDNPRKVTLSEVDYYLFKTDNETIAKTQLKYCDTFSKSQIEKIIESGEFETDENNYVIDTEGYLWYEYQNSEQRPFASKVLKEGYLHKRLTGKMFDVSEGENSLDFIVPLGHMKFSGIKLINCEFGDVANLKVLDSENGDYSGYPNCELDQFGYDVPMPNGMCGDSCVYDANLYQGMIVRIEYNSISTKKIAVHYDLHELR